MKRELILSDEEKQAIATLKRLAKRWPKTLQLFSWSGNLHVLKRGEERTYGDASADTVDIPNGGGDPSYYEKCP